MCKERRSGRTAWAARGTVALSVAVGLAGCGDGVGAAASVVRDSAGIRIVESTAPAWQAGTPEAWRIEPEPVVDIGVLEGDEAYQLFRVTGARRLSDGRIVVANSGTQELRFYDGDGTFIQAAGRQGSGPGEFERVELLAVLPGDTVAAFDGSLGRISYFGPDGAFLESVALAGGEASIVYRPLGLFPDRSILVMQTLVFRPGELPEGVNRRDSRYTRLDPDGTTPDSLGVFPGPTMFGAAVGRGGFFLTAVPFTPSPTAAVGPSSFFFGNGDGYVITEYGRDGAPVRVIRRPVDARPVTAGDVEAVKARRLETAPDENWRRRFEQMYSEVSFPETMPAYAGFVLADDGGLWVQAYEPPTGSGDSWTVFDPEGRMLGAVAVPGGFQLLQVGSDFLLGQWQDELEVEHVRMYRLGKPQGTEGA